MWSLHPQKHLPKSETFLYVGAWVAGGTGSHASHLLLTRAEGDGLLLCHQVLLLQVPRLLPLAGPALVLHLSMQPHTRVNTNYGLDGIVQGGNSKQSSCCSRNAAAFSCDRFNSFKIWSRSCLC